MSHACEAYSRNVHIPARVELANNDPTLDLHKHFLGFNLTYKNVIDYKLMHSLNATNLTLAQHEKLSLKLPNYSKVNYDLLKKQILQSDENYPFSMPNWLTVLITMPGTCTTANSEAIYCY